MLKLPASRTILSIILLLLFFLFLVAILFVTNLSFSVWEQLQQKPDWLVWSYLLVIAFISILFGALIWRFLLPKKKAAKTKQKKAQAVNNISATAQRLDEVNQRLQGNKEVVREKAEEQSDDSEIQKKDNEADVKQWESDFSQLPELAAIKDELNQYEQRKSQQIIYIALFGDISSGKSSLINALINADGSRSAEGSQSADGSQQIESSVIGGTTREISHYHWTIKAGKNEHQLILTDMPGLNEQFAELDLMATEEVQRAHIVLFLCDGDLTSSQFNELKTVLLLQKPCLVALNKADRYTQEELQLIIDRIKQRIKEGISDSIPEQQIPVFTIKAGGLREFIRLTVDGEEERVQRPVKPEVQVLQQQLLTIIQAYDTDQLEQLREKSVAQMVNTKLDDIEVRFKQSQSHRMVKSYTKKAVIASMATFTPGTDLLVQGYLGIQMIKDLCRIYDVPASDIDANKLIELVQARMKKTLPLLLAIAGNGLKAFPGIGTVTGGLMHAVAYGMIFDTLGHSVARTLEVTGELSPVLVSDLYKEKLGENIESRTKDFIKLVFKLRNSDR